MPLIKNPIYTNLNVDKEETQVEVPTRNELLEKHFEIIKKLSASIDLNTASIDSKNDQEGSPSEIDQIFVSVPTNISIDVIVEDKRIKQVYDGNAFYRVGEDGNKYKDCIDTFNEIISPNTELGLQASSRRSLLLRPYWKDGSIKNFLCLKPIDIIASNQYSIALGGPGSGKSTLLKYLSVLLANQYYSDSDLLREDAYSKFFFRQKYIPVFVQLRQLFTVKSIAQDPITNITKNALLQFLFDKTEYEHKWGELGLILAKNNVILFFDGIDEIFVGRNVCQVVQKLVRVAKEINTAVKIVFSSRKESYSTWQLNGFTAFELCPMDKPCQKLLARKVLETYLFRDFDEKYNTLIEQLNHCDLDERIVGNPLFLSLMVIIYAVNGALPDQKSVMLDQSIRFLIKRWQAKISSTNANNKYEVDQLYAALKGIAYSTINDAASNANPLIIKKETILTALEALVTRNALDAFIPNDDIIAKREMLLKCLQDSVGVIVPSLASDQFEFSHRHFQEYLVASKIVEQSDLQKCLLEMIILNDGIHHEIYFMVMEILFDKAEFSQIWGILKHFMRSPRARSAADTLKAWITWFCCRVVSLRDYRLLETAADYDYETADILKEINKRTNALISTTNELSLQQRIECARFLGEIQDKVESKTQTDFAADISKELGDKREGVSLNTKNLPDIIWCKIPADKFTMGITDEEIAVVRRDHPESDFSREQPCVELYIEEFEISKYPITIAQYVAFVKAGAYEKSELWNWSKVSEDWFEKVGSKKKFQQPNVVNAPIVDISWIEAAGFCVWLGNCTNSRIRLPYESEWEYVAKLHHRTYSYSELFDSEKYVSRRLGLREAAPVGVHLCEYENYPSDLTGNVWEWTQTLIPIDHEHLGDYARFKSKRDVEFSSKEINKDSRMVARGGSFLNIAFQDRNSYRGRDYIWNHITARQGFRIVKEHTK